jgi:hypothetical protein
MANRYAVSTGDWSNPAIWDGGTLPQASDVVRHNGFTVTIDQNITVDELTNNAAAPAVAGGSFLSTINVVINADIKERTTSTLYNINGGSSVTINGDCVSNPSVGSGSKAVAINTALTLTVNGSVIGGALNASTEFATNNQAIFVNSVNVNIVVNGTINGGGQSNNASFFNNGIYSNSTSTMITVTGTINGSPTNSSAANTKAGIAVLSTNSTIIVNGVVNGIQSAAIYTTNATTFVSVDGTISSSGIRYAIETSNLILKDVTVYNTIRNQFVGITNLLIHSTGDVILIQNTETIGDTKSLYTAGLLTGYPLEAKVEDGAVYGPSNEFEGTLSPVNIDTAQLAEDLLTELSTSSNALAERLRNVSTVQTTGSQLTALTIS